MATGKVASRASARGATARSEVNGRKKTVDFRGLKLKVPNVCPGEVWFDVGDDDVTKTLKTLVGEDQYRQMREKVADDGLSLQQTGPELVDFLGGLLRDTYGLTLGE